jgi:hypothetical protein
MFSWFVALQVQITLNDANRDIIFERIGMIDEECPRPASADLRSADLRTFKEKIDARGKHLFHLQDLAVNRAHGDAMKRMQETGKEVGDEVWTFTLRDLPVWTSTLGYYTRGKFHPMVRKKCRPESIDSE